MCLQVDLPTEHYYASWRLDVAERFQITDAVFLDLLEDQEVFLDVCCVSGFSLGASKSKNRICRFELDILGDICGRVTLQATEDHLRAIREWGPILDAGAMRRFLGTFQWVRKSIPVEAVVALPELTKQLRKDATWPMNAKQKQAQKALQKLAAKAVKLYSVDMIAAISGERPVEQVADWSGGGWGGAIT